MSSVTSLVRLDSILRASLLPISSCASAAENLRAMSYPAKSWIVAHLGARAAWRSIVSRILLGSGVAGVLLYFAGRIYTSSVDLGWHYSLVEYIVEHASLPAIDVVRLGPMTQYPPGAHALVAIITSLCGVNPLRFLFLSSVVFIFILYLLILGLIGNRTRSECFAKAIFLICLLVIFSRTHMLAGNEIIENFFYAQLVGDLGFIFLLVLLAKIKQPTAQGVLSITAVYLLAWVYTASAIKLALSIGLLQLLTVVRELSRERVLACIALAIVLPVTIVTHPIFEPMLRNAAYDGSISNPLPLVLSASTLLLLLVIGIWYLRLDAQSSKECEPFIAASAAIGLLAWVQFAFWQIAGFGSQYAVKKHGLLVGTFLAACLSILLARIAFETKLGRAFRDLFRCVPVYATRGIAACLAVVVVLPWYGEPLEPVIRYDKEVRAIVASGRPLDLLENTISLNRLFPMTVNFAIAMAVLHLPGWSPAAVDQLAVFGISEPMPSGVRYAVRVPPLPNLASGCVVENYLRIQVQLLRRDCVGPTSVR